MTTVTEINIVEELHIAHEQLVGGLRDTFEAALVIGRLLTDQKCKLAHGQFLPWLKKNVTFISESTCRRCMRLHRNREMLKSVNVTDLSEAYALLAAPKDRDNDDVVEAHVVDHDPSAEQIADELGVTVADMDKARRTRAHKPNSMAKAALEKMRRSELPPDHDDVIDADVDHDADDVDHGDDVTMRRQPRQPTLDEYVDRTCDRLQDARLRLERIGAHLADIECPDRVRSLETELLLICDVAAPMAQTSVGAPGLPRVLDTIEAYADSGECNKEEMIVRVLMAIQGEYPMAVRVWLRRQGGATA